VGFEGGFAAVGWLWFFKTDGGAAKIDGFLSVEGANLAALPDHTDDPAPPPPPFTDIEEGRDEDVEEEEEIPLDSSLSPTKVEDVEEGGGKSPYNPPSMIRGEDGIAHERQKWLDRSKSHQIPALSLLMVARHGNKTLRQRNKP
jgi:hypothetical protein